MAGDPLARLREALGLGPGVILSADEIEKALGLLPSSDAAAVRAQLAPPAEAPRKRYVFGGVPR